MPDTIHLELDKAKILRCSAEIVFDDTCFVEWTNPLPVLGRDGLLIGWASAQESYRAIDFSLVLVGECPERLDLENGEKLFVRMATKNMATYEVIEAIQLTSKAARNQGPLKVTS